ncbi:MAG: nucleoside triphosphate pyrophosphohydrolase [Gloeomargaritaceae cyanobacterium C42_A2020_066]|nr:nucleoside triphosphate pyrophosphohydrolase [Gloeomargaritaceae cyanobacterium C42_A2020_066]
MASLAHGLAVCTPATLAIAPDWVGPVLFTGLNQAADWTVVCGFCQSHWAADRPIEVITASGRHTTYPLGDLQTQAPPPLPCQLYLPDPRSAAVERLIAVVAQLRHPQTGCPWDLAQTPQSLAPYVLEEAYEVVHALRQRDVASLVEELGDYLLQVVLQAQIASETEQFDLAAVATGIVEKLIRRHPHVFEDVTVKDVAEVRQNWEAIKAQEGGRPAGLAAALARYTVTFPPLLAAFKLSTKVAAAGFEWPDVDGVWAKHGEEWQEFQEALTSADREAQEAELGDVLFTLVNLARWYGLDPSLALQGTNQRFTERWRLVEAKLERPLQDYTLAELEVFWQAAKRQLADG